MITNEQLICPHCHCQVIYYDSVNRKVIQQGRKVLIIKLQRYKCTKCKRIHRLIPRYIFPHKQYLRSIIIGVIDDSITCDIFEYEDYPCELTMKRWRTQKIQPLL